MRNKDLLSEYKLIINEIDLKCKDLHKQHKSQTSCKKGCCDCCINFSVLPIEFHSILTEISSIPKIELNYNELENCIFLIDSSCIIYNNRPSICRSHGLPILNMDIEGENWELSYCPLNFTKTNESYFTLENGFHQDVYNSKLYMLNQKFIKTNEGKAFAKNELIELRKIKDFL